jgi:hypothetical protein
MLTEGMDVDNAEEGNGLQHSEEMDEALTNLIALRKQSRKQGMLTAHRQALLVRSRSIDILEVRVFLLFNSAFLQAPRTCLLKNNIFDFLL